MEIRLTPTGQLRWEAPEGGTESAVLAPLRKAFQADWREGLFTLAAEKINLDAPTLRGIIKTLGAEPFSREKLRETLHASKRHEGKLTLPGNVTAELSCGFAFFSNETQRAALKNARFEFHD